MHTAAAPASQIKARFHYGWFIARRISQLGILALFLVGPWYGYWIVKGNLSSSLTLDVLPLTDLFVLLQSIASGHWPEQTALVGAAIVLVFYLLVGGRTYCSWVCPVNLVTDAAAWLRQKIGIRQTANPPRAARYWLLFAVLLASAATGLMVWEWVNPVSMFHRGLFFGMGLAWTVVAAVFVFDLFVAQRGWCGHLCPMGACYGLLNHAALLRVSAADRDACTDCMDCFRVCPEPQVIKPALKGAAMGIGPLITAIECTNCARCIDVCDPKVFRFATRFANRMEVAS